MRRAGEFCVGIARGHVGAGNSQQPDEQRTPQGDGAHTAL